MKLWTSIVAASVLLAAGARPADAGCNLIPSAQKTFRGALGSSDRPFAGPGDFVELRVRPAVCDAASVGISATPTDEVVTFIFTPPNGGAENIVVVASDCADIDSQLASDSSCLAAASRRCEDADAPGTPADLAVVERDGERRLLVRFPDTDADLAPGGDGHTRYAPCRRRPAGSARASASTIASPRRTPCPSKGWPRPPTCSPSPSARATRGAT